MKFGEKLVFGIGKQFGTEITESDMAGMVSGFDISLDFALYARCKNEKKRKRKRKDDDREYKRKRRLMSNLGLRESRDSSMRGSSSSGFKGLTKDRDRDHDKGNMSSRNSRMRGSIYREARDRDREKDNRAQITQTKFELNPPGFSDNNFQNLNNGVVLIMNQSQREYFKQ